MSTRSGKRIHSSFQEDIIKPDVEQAIDSVKKPRSKRLKENVEEYRNSIVKNKKRTNYVTYPTDDEVGVDALESKEDVGKCFRVLRRTALKEQNLSSVDSVETPTVIKKIVRTTRSTRKIADDAQEDAQNQYQSEDDKGEMRKSSRAKKIKQPSVRQITEEVGISKKKIKKKKGKKVKKHSSMIVEDIEPDNGKENSLNKSKMSNDSFHSAAGSPLKDDVEQSDMMVSPVKNVKSFTTLVTNSNRSKQDEQERRTTRSTMRLSGVNTLVITPQTTKQSRKRKSSTLDLDKDTISNELKEKEMSTEEPFNNTINPKSKKRKSTVDNLVSDNIISSTTIDKVISDVSSEDLEKGKLTKDVDCENSEKIKTADFDLTKSLAKINTTYDKDASQTRESTGSDMTEKSELSDAINNTYDKETPEDILNSTTTKNPQSVVNTTFEKSNSSIIDMTRDSVTPKPTSINTTFDKEAEVKQLIPRISINNDTFDKDEISEKSDGRNDNTNLTKSTLSEKPTTAMNSTFDKLETPDSTYEKDRKLDATFDKSFNSKSSLISSDNSNVTADKSELSRISITSDESKDIIVNTTPVLIESSLEESQMDATRMSLNTPAQVPLTPLKREGTFTKDAPEVEPSKLLRTPTKRMSLPSPGCTPYHPSFTQSALKEKSVMNVTRSVEKSRRSSLAEPLPRTTKVMFCSPVNNPEVVMQQRKKVIKSSLKGSNKSFVFEDNAPRAAGRKRSLTQCDAEQARAKRKRLADSAQPAPCRSRTQSATAKLAEPVTPSKKATPKLAEARIGRTRLPNFAALHRKEFAKMESLDECQERKARRAKALLTPTGTLNVLDRTSPKDNPTSSQNSPNDPKEDSKEQKKDKSKEPSKPETPVKSLPTLKSLNPGYTRFGFKLNLDVNPFSIPSKSDNDSTLNLSHKASRAKTSLFNFSSKKDTRKKDNTKPLKELKAGLTRQTICPSVSGSTSRREAAKQAVMREKSFTDKRNLIRNETRTVIKGVRTNRRFELQMRMRNID